MATRISVREAMAPAKTRDNTEGGGGGARDREDMAAEGEGHDAGKSAGKHGRANDHNHGDEKVS